MAMVAGSKAAFAVVLLASWGSISQGVRRTVAPDFVDGSGDMDDFADGSGSGSGSGDMEAANPCAVVAGATTRHSEDFPNCKCSDSGNWFSDVNVYCGDQEIDGRKFNATEVLAKCAAPYCARDATQTTTLSTTLHKSKTCAVVDGAVGRNEGFPLCKCPARSMSVFCEEWKVEGRKFNATSILMMKECHDPYCATESDWTRTTLSTTTTPTTTKMMTTTTQSTSSTFDASVTVDASPLFDDYTKFNDGDKTFKCCVHSQTNEVVVQNIAEGVRPRARSLCGFAEGCGCMFGDHWHSFDSDSPCVVKYSYLSEKTHVAAFQLAAMLS